MFRSKRLLNAAKGQSCMVQIPNVCNGNNDTVVAAHSNQLLHGKGMGIKAHDCFIAWACSSCHYEIDQGKMSKEDKYFYWQQGFERTILAMLQLGIIVVA
jgi:ferredoxin